MIIDCHGHFTTAPKELQAFRDEQIEGLKHPGQSRTKRPLSITDDQLREAFAIIDRGLAITDRAVVA
jgi:4-oxalmesaconate hydratase